MVNYKVDEANKTVKCVLIDWPHGEKRKSVGLASCSDSDVFDIEKGKNLAFYRARIDEIGKNISVYSETKKKLDNMHNEFTKLLDAKIEKQRKEIARLRQSIDSLF